MKIVIFCGGYGTRMWPISRKSYPKQFYPLIKGRSLFQLTLSRFLKIFKPEDIFISTEDDYIPYVKVQAPRIPKKNIIAEPERKDNLGAVGLATAIINKEYPSEVMMLSWSDHFILREVSFLKAVLLAGEYAKDKALIVSVDEKPSYPSVHHGWVKLGKVIEKLDGYKIFKILKHIEKPKKSLAERMFKSKKWLINTGYRAFRSDVMLSYYKEFEPLMYEGLEKIAKAWCTSDWDKVLHNEYKKFRKESIEYAIFEKMPKDKRVVIPVNVGWEDVGTWELFYKFQITKKVKTVVEGGVDTLFLNSQNNLIIGPKGKVIAIIGLSNIAVIDTTNALLVTKLDSTEKVKEVFKRLEKRKKEFVK